ncbi:MAG: hypothetical protein OCU12_05995 [Methanophagales archaeon]|nr:hypothetical protein [Methanophagales archaeon]
MNLDCQVVIGGVDYTSHVTGIERRATLCEQDHVATVTLDCNGSSILPYHEIVIHEQGAKVFTGYVEDITSRVPDYCAVITARTARKKLEDWWLDEEHKPSGGATVPSEIAWAMSQAGVSYTIEDGVGDLPVPSDRTWQYVSAWDMIKDLLRIGGLQTWADADNGMHIGRVQLAGTADFALSSFTGSSRDESDDYTRNGIAVYGSGVTGFVSATLDWLGTRERHGAFALPEVRSQSRADDLAQDALTEFLSKSDVIVADVEGNPDYQIMQLAEATEGFLGLSGQVYPLTGLNSQMNANNGYVMQLTLGERCPIIWGAGGGGGSENEEDLWPLLGTSETYPSCVTGPNIVFASWCVTEGGSSAVRIHKIFGRTITELYRHSNGDGGTKSIIRRSPDGNLWCAVECVISGNTYTQVIKSSDNGVNWTLQSSIGGGLVDFWAWNGVLALLTESGSYNIANISYDDGVTWPTSRSLWGGTHKSIAANSNYWYVVEGNSAESVGCRLRGFSHDGSESFNTQIQTHTGSSMYYRTAIFIAGCKVFVAYRQKDESSGRAWWWRLGFWYSGDNGKTETRHIIIKTYVPLSPAPGEPRLSTFGAHCVYVANEGSKILMWHSYDNGASWMQPPVDVVDISDPNASFKEVSVWGNVRAICWSTYTDTERVAFDIGWG